MYWIFKEAVKRVSIEDSRDSGMNEMIFPRLLSPLLGRALALGLLSTFF